MDAWSRTEEYDISLKIYRIGDGASVSDERYMRNDNSQRLRK